MKGPLTAATPPPTDQTYLVAVSGGRDSMALLHWLLENGCRQLLICHLDHGLRPESADDAAFVTAYGHLQRLPVHTTRVTIPADEETARHARYQYFATIARKKNCPRLILAHHADDQVETYLFNLLRGGPSAMRPTTTRIIDGLELTLLRPLLPIWREEIDTYLTQNRIPYREDKSNLDPRYTRNRIRHTALPSLHAAMGRDTRRAIWRAAEIQNTEDDYLATHPALANLPAQLEVPTIRALPLALQRRLIHQWLIAQTVPNVGYEQIEATLRLLTAPTAKVNLPGNLCARRRAKRIFIEPQKIHL